MTQNPRQEMAGTPVPSEEAWRVLDDWKARRKEIEMLFCKTLREGRHICHVHGAYRANQRGDGAGTSLDLKLAHFTYGPMAVWPNWPAGPTVDVLAPQACLATGDWLVLAEGYLPKELSPLALPM